jgi:ESS family glutamate:Na+ symporter
MSDLIILPGFIAIGMAVYFLGASLTRLVRFVRDHNFCELMSGGLAVAGAIWAIRAGPGTEIAFDPSVRDTPLVIFSPPSG